MTTADRAWAIDLWTRLAAKHTDIEARRLYIKHAADRERNRRKHDNSS